jgi:AcrR family transcriptional regulator
VVGRVRDGLFFHTPEALPRGRHSLARERIVEAQRERLLIAMTELIAACGYDAVRIGDVTERAAVSRAAFYESFPDKSACAAAAYDRFIEVLLTSVARSLRRDQPLVEFVEGALRGYLEPLQDDPVVGRAFQVEIDAMGPLARQRRRESLRRFADALAHHHGRLARAGQAGTPLALNAYLGAVYAVRQLASDALEREEHPDLLGLVPDLTGWLLKLLN